MHASAPIVPSDPSAPLTPGVRFLLWAVPAVTVIVAGLLHGTFFIDDAYITFRYAENIAVGHGMVFNPGEPVLGTTTPLFAAVLAGLKMLGIAVPTSARWLGLMSMAVVVLLLQTLAHRSISLPVAAAMGLCLALHPDTAYMATSGMETAPSLALVLGGLLLSLQSRWLLAGGVAGAALLMRPDGVLIVVLAVGVALLRDRKKAWQPLASAAAVVLPWVLYASATYGSPLPHSIKAKKLIHQTGLFDALGGHLGFLTQNVPLTILFGLGIVGVGFALARRSELLLVTLWMGAYGGSLAVSGIAPQFAWYATPLTVTGVLLAAYGIDRALALRLAKTRPDAPSWVRPTAAAAVLLVTAAYGLTDDNWRSFRTDLENREAAYLEIGAWIAERAQPGDVVFVGEVGVLGYMLLDQIVVDSAGINSPEVFVLRRNELTALRQNAPLGTVNPEGTHVWVQQTIDQFEPNYVVTKYPWLHIGKIEDNPEFQRQYTRVGPDNIMLIEYRVYERH
jgi:arabinofuranosyltransferase